MNPVPVYDIFVSHAWEYTDSYYRLLDYLDQLSNSEDNFSYLNVGEPEHDAPDRSYTEELKVEIKDQISQADLVVILSDIYAMDHHAFWVDFTMDYASEKNIPMVAIRPWDEDQTPDEIRNRVNRIVDWHPDAILKAVKNESRQTA